MLLNSNEYLHTVETIKQEIRAAQYKATVRVNQELLILKVSNRMVHSHSTPFTRNSVISDTTICKGAAIFQRPRTSLGN